MNDTTKKLLQIGNVGAAVATIIFNALANILPIGGKYTGELSDNIPNLFVPAGITFAIWGVIYLLIMIFSIYIARDFFKKEKITSSIIEKVSGFFILASIANIIWIFLWHYEYVVLSLLAMILLFVCLLMIYLRLNISKEKRSLKEKICIQVPISVYLGWITVATIANVTAALVVSGWNGFGLSQEIWTILVLIIATIIALLVLLKHNDYAYCLVFVWAFLGIFIKRIGDDELYGVQSTIAYTAVVCLLTIGVAMLILFYRLSIKKNIQNG
jgi:hypothetical protein